jgi:D-amino-acid dehydrogenase
MNTADVVVIGGGLIGLSIAEALARRGADVTVLEARTWGAGASSGNAGWVSPCLANPVPAPGVMSQAIRWMPNPRSPLLVRPNLSLEFLRWSWQFWQATNGNRYGAGMAALAALGRRVFADFDRLRQQGIVFETHSDGLLFVGRSGHAVDHAASTLRDAQALGYEGHIYIMTREDTLRHEPALSDRCAGSVLAVDERHVSPDSFVEGMVAYLSDRVDLRRGATVRAVTPSQAGGWDVDIAGSGGLHARRVVIASGSQSGMLLRPLGVTLPLTGGKGYSITVQRPLCTPKGPIYLVEDRVAVTPFVGRLRLAGTMELGTRDTRLRASRLLAIEAAAKRSLASWSSEGGIRWAGLRPMLPDGLPVIGLVPGFQGLSVATGHAMLGLTLAPSTAEILAPAVLDGRPTSELAPFSLARFGNRAPRASTRMFRRHRDRA